MRHDNNTDLNSKISTLLHQSHQPISTLEILYQLADKKHALITDELKIGLALKSMIRQGRIHVAAINKRGNLKRNLYAAGSAPHANFKPAKIHTEPLPRHLKRRVSERLKRLNMNCSELARATESTEDQVQEVLQALIRNKSVRSFEPGLIKRAHQTLMYEWTDGMGTSLVEGYTLAEKQSLQKRLSHTPWAGLLT
jgi:predicted DNA-binding transcriptional regulator